jgi:hypothetical protein
MDFRCDRRDDLQEKHWALHPAPRVDSAYLTIANVYRKLLAEPRFYAGFQGVPTGDVCDRKLAL